ncbi:MAG TPA: sigma-70 family RNA polymerase sigma factor [Candidatus Paceibacterota bacterium]|nr:sigma-70 family RNA polymerase sigma factor [Candidatus Paceibacterota bacterium]
MADEFITGTEKGLSAAREDAALVQRALESSEEFGRIIEKYQEPLRRYIRRIARPTPDELDMLLQDIFIKAYENLNDFDQDLSFSSWVYRIAHNESIDHLRRKKHVGASLDDQAYDDDTMTLAETMAADDDVLAEVDRDYVKKNITSVLDRLEPKYRSVLVLKFLEDKDYNDISDILRKPPGTVATLIHRAKKEFKRLADEGGMHLGGL